MSAASRGSFQFSGAFPVLDTPAGPDPPADPVDAAWVKPPRNSEVSSGEKYPMLVFMLVDMAGASNGE